MCENCPDEDNKLVKLRFVGGRGRTHPPGPWVNHEYGTVYIKSVEYKDNPVCPYWEYVGELSDEECEQYKEGDRYFQDEGFITTAATDDTEPVEEFSVSTESVGLTKLYGVATNKGLKEATPFTEKDIFSSMTVEQLREYITNNGGRFDGRWNHANLVEAALKLQ